MYTDHLFINVISEIDAALNICCHSFAYNIKLPLREKNKDGFLVTKNGISTNIIRHYNQSKKIAISK